MRTDSKDPKAKLRSLSFPENEETFDFLKGRNSKIGFKKLDIGQNSFENHFPIIFDNLYRDSYKNKKSALTPVFFPRA